MTKVQRVYYLAIACIIIMIILISCQPSYATIEITGDDYENITLTHIKDSTNSIVVENDNEAVERLLYWHPMQLHLELYKPFPTLDDLEISQDELELLASITFAEANLEPDLGQELITVTILNRLYDSQDWWGYDLNSIVDNPSQFNGATNPKFGYYTQQNLTNVINAIYKHKNGLYEEKYYDILYFHNFNIIDSEDYMDKYGLYEIIRIGGHLFMGEMTNAN